MRCWLTLYYLVDEADLRSTNITKCLADSGSRDNNIFAVMLDTQGPEIRTGNN